MRVIDDMDEKKCYSMDMCNRSMIYIFVRHSEERLMYVCIAYFYRGRSGGNAWKLWI